MTFGNVSFNFEDSGVIVTGAERGIGRAIVRRFLEAGAIVVAVDIETTELDIWAAKEPRLVIVQGSVAKRQTAQEAVEVVAQRVGGVHTLVNNAGILRDRISWKLSDDDWDAVLDTHLKGSFVMCREVIPAMRERGTGRIINLTSYAGIRGNFGQANYSAAKAGIIGLTRALAKELGGFDITVNAVSPNVWTQMIESIPEVRRHELIAETPLGRFGDVSEVAEAICFLASDSARYITGALLPVDGGISL